ncbi:MAG: hypothetical protein LKI39_14620 [Bacteroides sp.]|nr:hypothetical protein [Bacteroides sp.]
MKNEKVMDGIVQFLIIAGVIVIGIVKHLKKEADKSVEKKPDILAKRETSAQKVFIPNYEKKYGGYIPEDTIFEPKATVASKNKSKQEKNKTSSSYHNTTVSPPKNTSSSESIASQAPEATPDFNFHSIEEIRKAVIWSEILQRKY